MLKYKTQADKDSLYNTPNCWSIYICGLVFKWLKNTIGGLERMNEINIKKAKILYDCIDHSKLYKSAVRRQDRSLMNVFTTGDKDLDAKFVVESKAAGLENLKGHRLVGGLRASIFNAMPYKGVIRLVEFMEDFEKKNV